MFIGHFAVGFASKRAAPRVSLGWLTAAALLPDLLFPLFSLLGWEHVRVVPGKSALTALEFVAYPITHSLAGTCGWAVGLALVYWLRTRYAREAFVLSLAVLSHWLLDALTHRPDMPLYPGGPVVGLGLWNSVIGTVVVEGSLFVLAVWAYIAATRAMDRVGVWALRALIVVLGLLYWKHIAGPPPPSAGIFGWVALSAWLFPLWAWWIDRHRKLKTCGVEA